MFLHIDLRSSCSADRYQHIFRFVIGIGVRIGTGISTDFCHPTHLCCGL